MADIIGIQVLELELYMKENSPETLPELKY